MDAAAKNRENRARRAAARQGMRLAKSRRRDPQAIDFGKYMLIGAGDTLNAEFTLTLDEVERTLRGEQE